MLRTTNHATRQVAPQTIEVVTDTSEKSYSTTPPPRESSFTHHDLPGVTLDPELGNTRPTRTDVAVAINLYFKFCHKQPIWCLEREDINDYASLPDELACSILALMSRFSEKRDQWRLYGNTAKTLIMLRIANGSVDLATIESLCLLAYSSFVGKKHF